MQGVSKTLIATITAAALLCSVSAAAQNKPVAPDEPVTAKGVGISGGVIAGAEVVLLTEAIIDVKPTWPWWVLPILGAGGGGVGGYYLEKNSPKGAIGLLVGSMVMMIPTAVAVSIARAYDPDDESPLLDDNDNMGEFSFELDPVDTSENEEAVTEVDARPKGIPDNATTPVGPAPADESPSAAPEPKPAPEPESNELHSISEIQQQKTIAHLTSGSIFHIDRDWDAGFGIPAIDVHTVSQLRDTLIGQAPKVVEVSVPLLKIDLP